MNAFELKHLLKKFVQGTCTPEEMQQVAEYCRQNELTPDFPTVEEVMALLERPALLEPQRSDALFNAIMEKAHTLEEKPKKKAYWKISVAAASVLLLLTLGISYQRGLFTTEQHIKLTGNEITLQLENGDIQVIAEDGTSQIIDSEGKIVGKHDGNKIAYSNDSAGEELAYNTLKIPYGKRFEVQLSDGTAVHLNSGTTLKYPVKFIAGQNRQVYLDGEAFFDVAKDKAHPFIVNADEVNVRVLGTHFNVSNYPEDDRADVVLVEGSVGMYKAGENFDPTRHTILKPGEKGSFNKSSQVIDKRNVVTDFYTAWIDGKIMFKNMAFRNISKKLERHYDVTIVNHNASLAAEKFSARFGDEPIEKVLGYFSEIQGFTYTIKNNIVTIN